MDPKIQQQLIEIFQAELAEQVQAITDCLLILEKSPKDPENQERINTIFRAAHNIKGSARSIGLETIGEIAHALEDLFSEFRQGSTSPNVKICNLCFEALDAMSASMEAFIKKTDPDFDIQSLLSALKKSLTQHEAPSEKPEPSSSRKASGSLKKRSKKSSPEDTPPKDKKPNANSMRVSIEKLSDVSAISDELLGIKIKNEDLNTQVKLLQNHIKNINKLWGSADNALKKYYRNNPEKEVQSLHLNAIDQGAKLNNSMKDMQHNMRSVHTEFGLIANSLQENIRVLRLVPVSTVLRPLLRTARDMAQELNKKIDVTLIGEEIEVDRSILEHIKSPLIHLIRNSLDHGIENSEERKRKNKSDTGKIIIKIEEEGSQIFISVSDDGRGINLSKVLEVAIEKKLIIEEEARKLSEKDILDFLTVPGFSTQDIITEISGRGVGLDVVQTNIQEVKGTLDIKTEKSCGTTITMQLPLTLITDRGIMVRMQDQFFIVPTTSVISILNLSSEKIYAVEGGEAVLLDDQPVPLYSASAILNINTKHEEARPSDQRLALILFKGRSKIAFIVDEIIREREIVIKPLMPPLTKTQYFSGAALNGPGDVILVLHPSELINAALHDNAGKLRVKEEKIESVIPNILVVDDAITTRVLEVNILENKGYRVKSAVNGVTAWEALQKYPFDLVITDIEMPVMDGFELTEKIKKDPKFKELPVVIVTSCVKDKDKKRGIEVGADAYITKNQFETKVLLDIVKQLL